MPAISSWWRAKARHEERSFKGTTVMADILHSRDRSVVQPDPRHQIVPGLDE